MAKKRSSRIYWRNGRAWFDGRDFADVGGTQESLVPPGERYATKDPDVAAKMAAALVETFEKRRRNRSLLGVVEERHFGEYCAYHLEEKAEAGNVTERTLAESEGRLRYAVDFFGEDRGLGTIGTLDVQAWLKHLKRTRRLSSSTLRTYLMTLSNVYSRAISEGIVTLNPAASLMDKPRAEANEARWLEVHEAALLLEAARVWRPDGRYARPNPELYAIIATFLLTGGRKREVLGLDVSDLSFDRKTIRIGKNVHRRVKNTSSGRTVPMWPQLESILREHVFGGQGPRSGLLFRSHRANASTGEIIDLRKALDSIAVTAGWAPGEIRTRIFRTTYATARLQTLDQGAPVSVWTVSREMGHGSMAMLEKVYGKLGSIRHRSEVVEYKVENHRELLAERLERLGASS